MKRLHTGKIVLEVIDLVLIGLSAGGFLAFFREKYQNYKIKHEDPIVGELKRISPRLMLSSKGSLLKIPLVRGGDKMKIFSFITENKMIAKIVMDFIFSKENEKKLLILQYTLFFLNNILTDGFGLRVAVAVSPSFLQIILVVLPSTIGGFVLGTVSSYPLASALLPLTVLFGRKIEDVPDPAEQCRMICKVAEQYHNRKMLVEMQKTVLPEPPAGIELPGPLVCIEQRTSLVQRYKLRSIVERVKAEKQIVHFDEFIKKFPECAPDPLIIYQKITDQQGNL